MVLQNAELIFEGVLGINNLLNFSIRNILIEHQPSKDTLFSPEKGRGILDLLFERRSRRVISSPKLVAIGLIGEEVPYVFRGPLDSFFPFERLDIPGGCGHREGHVDFLEAIHVVNGLLKMLVGLECVLVREIVTPQDHDILIVNNLPRNSLRQVDQTCC